MSNRDFLPPRQVLLFLAFHLLLILIIPNLFTIAGGTWDYLIVALAAMLLFSLLNRRYAIFLFWLTAFLLYLILEIVISNVSLAWLIVQPKLRIDPGIISVPLTVTTALEITVLSLAIAATPGTMVVELGQSPDGRLVLYVHTINVGDPDRFRATIKNGFERMVLNISKGVAA
jgi:multicomponent Na+:H+ antiporter subunit E